MFIAPATETNLKGLPCWKRLVRGSLSCPRFSSRLSRDPEIRTYPTFGNPTNVESQIRTQNRTPDGGTIWAAAARMETYVTKRVEAMAILLVIGTAILNWSEVKRSWAALGVREEGAQFGHVQHVRFQSHPPFVGKY